nr:NADH-cytochrome b5 reductase 2-like [Dermacentor andersoni]
MLQLLHHVIESCDQTRMILVDVNASEGDIMAREELDCYALRFSVSIRIWHVLNKLPLSNVPKIFVQGPLTKSIVAALLPSPGPKTVVLCCGPPNFLYEVCKPALRDVGHDATRVLIF